MKKLVYALAVMATVGAALAASFEVQAQTTKTCTIVRSGNTTTKTCY